VKQGVLVGIIGLLGAVSALIFAQGKKDVPAVILKGGFETDRKDHGRPVVLVAVARVSYGKDLKTNGSITEVKLIKRQ
jgi:hypothetical protein